MKKVSTKSGKNTARVDSKKRKSLVGHPLIEAPSTMSTINQYSNATNHELSSRIAAALGMGDSAYAG